MLIPFYTGFKLALVNNNNNNLRGSLTTGMKHVTTLACREFIGEELEGNLPKDLFSQI
jgi:hypothetical protein